MSEVISKITKNAREVVFLSLSEFKGRRLIDIRVHVPGDQEGDWVPTRKGVSLAVSLYPAFKQGLAQLERALHPARPPGPGRPGTGAPNDLSLKYTPSAPARNEKAAGPATRGGEAGAAGGWRGQWSER